MVDIVAEMLTLNTSIFIFGTFKKIYCCKDFADKK